MCLEQLQTSAGVTDKTALAVIMGNIEQESRFRLIYVKVDKLSLMTCAYVEAMVLYNGLRKQVTMVLASSVKNMSVTLPAWKVRHVT